MKTPPLLLSAALLFWGWQTGFFLEGVLMAVILESSRLIKARLEFSDDNFALIWTFTWVLFLAAAIYTFNNNSGPSEFGKFFQNPNPASERLAGNAGALTALALIRRLPMIFFPFIAAQAFSHRDGVALESLSPFLRRRLKKTRKNGEPLRPLRRVNVLYPYFALCLFSAGGHAMKDNSFYFGFCALLVWALWPQRSRRFSLPVWIAAFAVAVTAGYFVQLAFGQLARLATESNPQWLTRLFIRQYADPAQTQTAIGHIGRLKLSGKIVIRIEPENGNAPPFYLREASYRAYLSPAWLAGNSQTNNFSAVIETPHDSGNWPLQRGPANPDVINIACYLDGINRDDQNPEGLLPLPTDCSRLENLSANLIWQNSGGAVLADGPRLMIFDARFGSGSTMDAPPDVNGYFANQDLMVPTNEPALDKVISQLNVSNKSDDEKIMAVGDFFADNFKYSLWQSNAAPLGRFLLDTRSGHCEYFATATVLLLRKLGIPARYAVGYFVHEASGHGYVVRLRDAHSWCLVWNKKNRVWRNFDTTPVSWISEEEKRASSLQFLSDFQSWLQFEILKFVRYRLGSVRQYVFWALIPALGFLLYRILRGSRRHQKKEEPAERFNWPGLDSEFYRLEQKLVRHGLPRQPGEPLTLWVQRATRHPGLAELKHPLENLLLLHYRHRFDPRGLDPDERRALRREVEACLSAASVRR